MMLEAFGTNAVGQVGFGVGAQVCFDALPVSRIIANALAVRAHREQTAKRLEVGERIRQFGGSAACLQLRDNLPSERL